jgi:hypothetical protein
MKYMYINSVWELVDLLMGLNILGANGSIKEKDE